MLPLTLTFLLLPILSNTVAYAANSWDKPCFEGECSYVLPMSNGMSGTLKISGSPSAISDITAAAGWTILDCKKDALNQDIRLVCNSDGTDGAGCEHLDQKFGAVGKLVRLPESCGKSAFARVTKAWVSKDQSIPPNLARRIVRRDGSEPEVRALSLDTNFSAVDTTQTGEISFSIQGFTLPPNANGSSVVTPPSAVPRSCRRGHRFQPRADNFVNDALDKFHSMNYTLTKNVDVDKAFPIISQSLSCPIAGDTLSFSAGIQAEAVAKAHAAITLGVAATGTLSPPKLKDFGLFAGMDAELDGMIRLSGNAAGKVGTGRLTLFQIGVPGLDFPGILTVGPTFKILAEAAAEVDIGVALEVGLSYKINDAKLFFPPSKRHKSAGSYSPSNGPLKLSVSPSFASKAAITTHLIPRLDLGVTALGGAAKAVIFLDLDASASVGMSLNADANVSINPPVGSKANVTTSSSFNGCVNAGAAFNVVAGAEGSLFGILSKTKQVNLFSKEAKMLEKCFGPQPPKRAIDARSLYRRADLLPPHEFSFTCPTIKLPNLMSLI